MKQLPFPVVISRLLKEKKSYNLLDLYNATFMILTLSNISIRGALSLSKVNCIWLAKGEKKNPFLKTRIYCLFPNGFHSPWKK